MFEFLNKYAISLWIHLNLESVPIQDNLLLFCIDRLLAFHYEHTEIRKLINNSVDNIDLTEPNFSSFKKEVEEVVSKQVWVNNHIRTYFTVLILEIAKDLELKENSIYKKVIDEKISIRPYRRIKNYKWEDVWTMSELIVHFRDAISHNQTKGISDSARLKESVDISSTNHLNFLVDSKTREQWCFMIWDWILNYEELDLLMQIILKVWFSKFPYSSPPT